MSDWKEARSNFLAIKQSYDTATSDEEIRKAMKIMNSAISNFINRGGVSSDPTKDTDYLVANKIFGSIQEQIKSYIQLNGSISKKLNDLTKSGDIQTQLREVGTLQQNILKSKKELEDATNDVDTSLTRQYAIETPRQEISWYQGFGSKLGFVKPLYHTSAAFMIGLGVLLLFLSTLMLREFFSTSSGTIPQGESGFGDIFSVFTDTRFISALMGVSIALVVVIVLTIKGYLGKNLR
jgi:archaellum component FlaC